MHIKFGQQRCNVWRPKNLTPWRNLNAGYSVLEADAMTAMPRCQGLIQKYFLTENYQVCQVTVRPLWASLVLQVKSSILDETFSFQHYRFLCRKTIEMEQTEQTSLTNTNKFCFWVRLPIWSDNFCYNNFLFKQLFSNTICSNELYFSINCYNSF
jgi:hypothetical protein